MAKPHFAFLRRLAGHRRGNVLMMFALALPAMTASIGMGVDYARAMQARTKLNAIADAAALSAVSRTAMGTSDSKAASNASMLFRSMSAGLTGTGDVTLSSLTVNAPTDSNGRRNATVAYKAVSKNMFASLLGLQTLTIVGNSATTNAIAPDINFYMLLDVSSSMSLPTTTAGLAKVAASNSQKCQFACHVTNSYITGTDANGNSVSLYDVAKSYGLTLRIDEEATAVAKLTSNATNTSSKNGAKYQIAISTFRGAGAFTILQGLTPDMAKAARQASNVSTFEYYSNNCPTSACKAGEPGKGDMDTGTSDAMDQISAQLLRTPGTGIGNDEPQGVMFLVTDGMRDEYRPGGVPEAGIDTGKCDTIKAKGIRIAILYTEYLPESLNNDTWSQNKVKPILYEIEPALQACASPGLYTKITTNQDIYTALDGLFQNAVATARITR